MIPDTNISPPTIPIVPPDVNINDNDDVSLSTADYVRILPEHLRPTYPVPDQVVMTQGVSTVSDDSSGSTNSLNHS